MGAQGNKNYRNYHVGLAGEAIFTRSWKE